MFKKSNDRSGNPVHNNRGDITWNPKETNNRTGNPVSESRNDEPTCNVTRANISWNPRDKNNPTVDQNVTGRGRGTRDALSLLKKKMSKTGVLCLDVAQGQTLQNMLYKM